MVLEVWKVSLLTSGKFGRKECLIDTELSCLPVLGVAKNGHCFVYCPVSGLHPPKIYQKLGGILLEKNFTGKVHFKQRWTCRSAETRHVRRLPYYKTIVEKKGEKITLHLLDKNTQEDHPTMK